MNKQAEYYEMIGDTLKGNNATRSYRFAQSHLTADDPDYLDDLQRLQKKIIDSLGK